MIEQLINLAWNPLLPTINNDIMNNRFVVHDGPMLYPVSYLPLFATQHLPSLAGEQNPLDTPPI